MDEAEFKGELAHACAVDDTDASYWEAQKSNNFEFTTDTKKGNPASGRWNRWCKNKKNAEKKSEYDALKDQYDGRALQDAQKKWRTNWNRDEYEKHMTTLKKEVTVAKESFTDAMYYTIGKIAMEEGGGKQGCRNSVNWALKAIACGKPYWKCDTWSKDYKFLYKVQGIRERMETKWTTLKE
eukprot:1647230-Pyramimonas_sp.AAC.1